MTAMDLSLSPAALAGKAQLHALRNQEREQISALGHAQMARDRIRHRLNDAKDITNGYERSKHPEEIRRHQEAKAEVTKLTAQLGEKNAAIATIEAEILANKAAIAALLDGQTGYAVAAAAYQAAKENAQHADQAVKALLASQSRAADSLTQATHDQAQATTSRNAALDADSLAQATAQLGQARTKTETAQTLLDNLAHQLDRLKSAQKAAHAAKDAAQKEAFRIKAAVLTDALRLKAIGPALEAFAAARLGGSGFSFREWLADALDPHREYLPTATHAYQTALLAELENATLEEPAHG